MFEKIGITLDGTGEVEVSIIGYPSVQLPSHPSIQFHSLPAFRRLSCKRLIIPWLVFKKINQVKPELVIINTPELLLVAILNRIFFGRKIVYDIRENYYRNIRHTSAFPALLRIPLALAVRLIEMITAPLFHKFFLAEKGYKAELGFAKPAIVLENKLPKSLASKYLNIGNRGYSKLLFSGTLATSTGVFEAIRLCHNLYKIDPSFSLTIVGYCSDLRVLAQIKAEILNHPYIKLVGGDRLVPHPEILQQISQADLGIIIYPTNPSTQSSIPTKLYEYLALKLPVLIRHNSESHQLVSKSKAGVILDASLNYSTLSATLRSTRFSPSPLESVFWESQAEVLIDYLKLR